MGLAGIGGDDVTDRESLLRNILLHPEDDLPRLVMADWLQEHDASWPCDQPGYARGEPHAICAKCKGFGVLENHYAARAEFIRIQCELARMPPRKVYRESVNFIFWHNDGSVDLHDEGMGYPAVGECVDLLLDNESRRGGAERNLAGKRVYKAHWHGVRITGRSGTGGYQFRIDEGSGPWPGQPLKDQERELWLGGVVDQFLGVGGFYKATEPHLSQVWPGGSYSINATVAVRRGFVERVEMPLREFVGIRENYAHMGEVTWREGHAADLFRREPISEVILTDRQPYHNGAGHSWFNAERTNQAQTVAAAANLPRELFVLLDSNGPSPSTYYERYWPFPTVADANRRLSEAAARLGRRRAGLSN